ncbi:MAG: glycyl-radical enzyme activating protein [Clostridia bacterium]|nr:glycyl-radical enzyme activating protein [Clostridia bacterium]
MNGILMDIKRMAVHDGPGLRTTLFLKGCPLSCIWCHNPEGQDMKPQIAWFSHKCVSCDLCTRACPFQGARDMKDRDKCIVCGKCVSACPTGARKLYGREITPEEALAIALEDRVFYGTVGGITLSGGEPLMQPDFALKVLEDAKKAGITTCLDTCGYAPWGVFEKTLDICDTYLYDIKHMDDAMHTALTGKGNAFILSNLKKLSERGARIQIRIPLIPNINDSPEHIAHVAKFLKSVHPECVKVLPYHQMARMKYLALGLADPLPESADDLTKRAERAKDQLITAGLKAYI